jgi:hypothetical protein
MKQAANQHGHCAHYRKTAQQAATLIVTQGSTESNEAHSD